MKTFNKKLAQSGKKVCTRDGGEVRILEWNLKGATQTIVGIYQSFGKEAVATWDDKGNFLTKEEGESSLDLMLADEHYEGYVNVFRHNSIENGYYFGSKMYLTEETAEKEGRRSGDWYVCSVKIEWND